MKPLIACTTLCLAFAAGPAAAAPGEKDAIAMTERAAALIKEKGKLDVVTRILEKDPAFVQEGLYLDIRDLYTGIVLAHPIDAAMVGTDRSAAVGAQGGQYSRLVIELAQKSGKGWVDYQYRHPASGVIEAKASYVLRVGDVVIEAGIKK